MVFLDHGEPKKLVVENLESHQGFSVQTGESIMKQPTVPGFVDLRVVTWGGEPDTKPSRRFNVKPG